KTQSILLLFGILLFGLIVASFLGGSKEGFSSASATGPNGGSAEMLNVNGTYEILVTDASGNNSVYTYQNEPNSQSVDSSINQGGDYSGSSAPASVVGDDKQISAGYVTGPNGNSAGYVKGPQGNVVAGTNATYNPADYASSLPPGIPASMIPPGQEDLYILKSQVVPPVCPACPTICPAASASSKKCPPCPPCGRCKQPDFTCKKVPNYSSGSSNSYLPVPVVDDFSSFGM
ncbi:MAG: hypothetical protein ORN50_07360, partial [Crocinitomicaceae bacterium]|nr:hypothetical protein [Crocinitomicaceae bacterium]